MDIWQPIDNIKSDDERFRQIESTNFYCDRCDSAITTFPSYHLEIPNKFNSFDFCNECFETPFEIIFDQTRKVAFSVNCLFCRAELSVIPTVAKIKGCHIKMYVCDQCSTDVEKQLRKTSTRLTSDFAWIERRKPLLANVSDVDRVVPANIAEQLTLERAELWVSLMEDIVLLPRDFGSLKQWCIFTDEFSVNTNTVVLLVDCGIATSGRVAAIVSDECCRARVYIIFDSLDKFDEHCNRWQTCVNRKSHKIKKRIHSISSTCEALSLLRNFLGYFMLLRATSDES